MGEEESRYKHILPSDFDDLDVLQCTRNFVFAPAAIHFKNVLKNYLIYLYCDLKKTVATLYKDEPKFA